MSLKIIAASLMLFLALSTTVKGQNYIYEFNKNGELVKGPPSRFPTGSTLDVRIPFDTVIFKRQVDSVVTCVFQTTIRWKIIRDKINTPEGIRWKPFITDLISELSDFHDALAGRPVAELLALSDSRSNEQSNYMPSPGVFISWLTRQVGVVIKPIKSESCDTLPLKLDQRDCIWGYSLASPVKIEANTQIHLYREDAIHSMVIDWYGSRIGLFPYEEFQRFDEMMKADSVSLKKFKDFLATTPPTVKAGDAINCTLFGSVNEKLNELDTALFAVAYNVLDAKINKVRSWVLGFVWLNKNGLLRVNPWDFTNPELYIPPKATVSNASSNDTIALQAMKLLEKKVLELPDYKDLVSAWSKRDSIKNRSDSLKTLANKQQQVSQTTGVSANAKSLDTYEQTEMLLNKVRIYVSSNHERPIYIRNYYFNRRPDKKDFKYDYPDDDTIIVAVYNRPANTSIGVIDQVATYTEQPMITENTVSMIPQTSTSAGSIASTSIVTVLDSKNFMQTGVLADLQVIEIKPSSGATNIQPTSCDNDLVSSLNTLKHTIAKYVFWDSLYNATLIPPQTIERTTNDSSGMVTDIYYPDGSQKAPYQYKYKITVKDTSKNISVLNPIDSSGFRVGKRRLVELAVGAAYALTSVRQVNVATDSTTGNLQPSSSETKLQFIVGLKFHLIRGVYWENNEFVFSCKGLHDGTWKERLSLFVGTSITNPLKNIYVGPGIDLIPGLNLNMGMQWYQYTRYNLNNNVIVNQTTTYRPALYLAITADPTLIVNIVKTFF